MGEMDAFSALRHTEQERKGESERARVRGKYGKRSRNIAHVRGP